MGNRGGSQSEQAEHDRSDAGLEADQDGDAANQFNQADDDGGCGRQRQADAGEPAGGA
ncbi:hypothetical protein GCM10010836_46750 [Aminobacter aminovorans]